MIAVSIGAVSVNVVPRPRSVWIVSEPPSAWALACTTSSPTPRPDIWVAVSRVDDPELQVALRPDRGEQGGQVIGQVGQGGRAFLTATAAEPVTEGQTGRRGPALALAPLDAHHLGVQRVLRPGRPGIGGPVARRDVERRPVRLRASAGDVDVARAGGAGPARAPRVRRPARAGRAPPAQPGQESRITT